MPNPKSIKPLPSTEYLRQCFFYSGKNGGLVWRNRPREHSTTDRGWRSFNTQFAGWLTNCVAPHGYVTMTINRRSYLAARVIWKMVTGEDPVDQIDHKNLDRTDNSWKNLRPATDVQNARNKGLRKDNTSGHQGVVRVGNRWGVTLKNHWIGLFETFEEAVAAREAAAREAFGEFYNG